MPFSSLFALVGSSCTFLNACPVYVWFVFSARQYHTLSAAVFIALGVWVLLSMLCFMLHYALLFRALCLLSCSPLYFLSIHALRDFLTLVAGVNQSSIVPTVFYALCLLRYPISARYIFRYNTIISPYTHYRQHYIFSLLCYLPLYYGSVSAPLYYAAIPIFSLHSILSVLCFILRHDMLLYLGNCLFT